MSGKSSRGPHPKDRELFEASQLPGLREAVADLSWIRSKGYAEKSSLKLVGDRYELTARQRVAVARCACGDENLHTRLSRRIAENAVGERVLLIDGFNVLTTIEAAMAGGILLRGRDGCIRDMSSMHGNYRVIEQSRDALRMIFETLEALRINRTIWYFDKPVSNSGRLSKIVEEVAGHFAELKTEVVLVNDPDPILKAGKECGVVATADSGILDECGEWMNLVEPTLLSHDMGFSILSLNEVAD